MTPKRQLAAVPASDVEVIKGPASYFGNHGIDTHLILATVLEHGPIATGLGGTLWHYRQGVWLPGGENEAGRRVSAALGGRWRKNHSELVRDWFREREPDITNEPQTRWINCRNGLLEWQTGTLHDHNPEIFSTWQLTANWNPEATCPTVDDWIDQVAPPDAINLIWQVIGGAIYADLPAHRAIMLYGPGRNGKGTLLRLIKALVGTEHCAAIPLQALGGENRFAVAELLGKAVNLAGDLDARSIGRTDIFKMATGGDLIEAERKYGQPFRFTNRALMIFAANELPGTSDHSAGFHSRWVVVPFDKMRLKPEDEDPDIEHRMHLELEGVLVKAVAGLRDLLDSGGFDIPESVAAATLDFRDQSDPVRGFVEDRIKITGNHDDKESRKAVFDSYKNWCDDENRRPLGSTKFWSRIRTIDGRIDIDTKVAGVRMVRGIELESLF